jgi:2-C-methyl-D-erythritol 4-phosphate cytidylyltransferase
MDRYALIVAGGTGLRMGAAIPKQFLPLPNGVPILVQTFQVFAALPKLNIIVLLPESHIGYWRELTKTYSLDNHLTLAGGLTRTASVAAGMLFVPDGALVAIHDGVRPYIAPAIIEKSFDVAESDGAACTAVQSLDSLRQVMPNGASRAVPRIEYFTVQTPQTFQAKIWKAAYAAAPGGEAYTDDASLVEAAGYPITLVEGDYANRKITTPSDLD